MKLWNKVMQEQCNPSHPPSWQALTTTVVQQSILAVRPNTQLSSCIWKPETDTSGICLLVNKHKSISFWACICIKILYRNLVYTIRIPGSLSVKHTHSCLRPHPEHLLTSLTRELWIIIFHNKITILYSAQTQANPKWFMWLPTHLR